MDTSTLIIVLRLGLKILKSATDPWYGWSHYVVHQSRFQNGKVGDRYLPPPLRWRDRTSLHTVDLDLDIVDVNELIQRVDKVSFMWSFKLQHIIALLDHCFRLNLGGCQAILSINKI